MLFRRLLIAAIALTGLAFPIFGRAQEGSPSVANWASFHGGSSRTGHTDDPGPNGTINLRWRLDTALDSANGSPVVVDGVVYMGTHLLENGALLAADLETGQRLWVAELAGDFSGASPAVANGMVFIAGLSGNLFAVDAETGELAWKVALDDGTTSSPAISGEMLFIGDDGDRLYALDATSGDELWRFDVASGGDYTIDPSPAVQDGVVYVSTLHPEQDESLFALDAETGQQLWAFAPESPGLATPAVFEEVVYVGGLGGRLYALDSVTGVIVWDTEIGDTASAPAVGPGTVFAHAGGNLVAVDAQTGAERWRATAGGVWSSPTLAGNAVIVGGNGREPERGLFAFDPTTGNRRWQLQSVGSVLSSPVVVGGLVLFGSDDGAVYSFDGVASDGTGSNGDGAGSYFSPFVFSSEIDALGLTVSPKTSFSENTTRLFAVFDFAGMANKIPFKVTWTVDGELLGTRDDVWQAGKAGHAFEHISSNEGNLPPGEYEIVLTIFGSDVLRGKVEIG